MIYMVLEYGDIDLARLLAKQESASRSTAGAQPDENFIRLYWQQMLQVRSSSGLTSVLRCEVQCAHLPFALMLATLACLSTKTQGNSGHFAVRANCYRSNMMKCV